MDRSAIQATVSELIRAGKTAAAFAYVREQPLGAATARDLAILEGDFAELQRADAKGILSYTDKQLRLNQIHDRLLGLLAATDRPPHSARPQRWWLVVPLILLLGLGLWGWWPGASGYACPDFPPAVSQRILVLPFENIGGQEAKPQVVLLNRINELAQKNGLPAIARLGAAREGLTLDQAPALGEACGASLVVWGTYSGGTDSLRVVLQYCFTDFADWNNAGELIALKDVTALYRGSMIKPLDDAILALCGMLAVREGDRALAVRWFERVEEKDTTDRQLLGRLQPQ